MIRQRFLTWASTIRRGNRKLWRQLLWKKKRSIIKALLAIGTGLRFRVKQLQVVLQKMHEDCCGSVNATNKCSQDWARATAISLGILTAHARRLRNSKLFAQAATKVTGDDLDQLTQLRAAVLEKCPLSCRGSSPAKSSSQPSTPMKKPRTARSSTHATAMEGWPDFTSSSSDHECAPVDFGTWPSFDASPKRPTAGAAPPAPSSLSKAQLALVVAEAQTVPALHGAAQLKRGSEKDLDKGSSNVRTIGMGTIKVGCYTEQSYIQVREENRWRSVCYCSARKSPNHKTIMQAIFAKAVKYNFDEDDMRMERDRMLDESFGEERA